MPAAAGGRAGLGGLPACRRRSRCPPPSSAARREPTGGLGRSPGDESPPSPTLSDVRVAVTGSHGLIGTALRGPAARADGHEPVRIVRSSPAAGEIGWDPPAGRLDPAALVGIDAVVNLAGAGIGDQRWTDDYKREVLESAGLAPRRCSPSRSPPSTVGRACCCPVRRSGSTATAATRSSTSVAGPAPASSPTSPRRGRRARRRPSGRAAGRAPAHRHRAGPARAGRWRKMLPLFKVGLGGRFGSGRQWMSWISLDDEVGAIVHLLDERRRRAGQPDGPDAGHATPSSPTRIGDVLHRPTVAAGAGVRAASSLLGARARRRPAVRGPAGAARRARRPTASRSATRRWTPALRAVLGRARRTVGVIGPIEPDRADSRAVRPVATPAQRATSAARSSGSRPACSS